MKLVTKLMTVILSRAIRPKIHFVKYRYLHFLLKIYLRVYRRERFQICIEIWPWKIWDLKKNVHSRFGKMIQIRFLKDLRFKLKIRFSLRFAHRWVWSAVFFGPPCILHGLWGPHVSASPVSSWSVHPFLHSWSASQTHRSCSVYKTFCCNSSHLRTGLRAMRSNQHNSYWHIDT